jgi:hypothetical protein
MDKEKAKDEMAIENGAKAGPERAEQATASEKKPVKPKGQPAGGLADYLPAGKQDPTSTLCRYNLAKLGSSYV